MGNAQTCAKIIKQGLCPPPPKKKKFDFAQGCAKKLIYKIENGYGYIGQGYPYRLCPSCHVLSSVFLKLFK